MSDQEGARALARALHRARLVVFDEELDVVGYWNGSETFNVAGLDGTPIDVFVVDVERSPEKAREAIEHHFEDYRRDLS